MPEPSQRGYAAATSALAEPGAVVISASTRRVAGGLFEYRDLGLVALKGWTQPTPVWQVLGTSGAASRFEAQHTTRLTPLLGRADEIELLTRRGATVTYSDPYVPSIDHGGHTLTAVALDQAMKAGADCAVIITDHKAFDYPRIVQAVRLAARNSSAPPTRPTAENGSKP